MKKSDYNLRGWPWMILTVLFVWLLPQRAAATAYLEDADNYTVMLGGSNIVRFSAPVYDKKGLDQWITDGNLKVTVDGTTNTVFHWEVAETDISDSRTWVNCKFSTTADGFFDISSYGTSTPSRVSKSSSKTIAVNGSGDQFYFEAEWVVPYNLLGKEVKFSWYVKRDGNGYDNIEVKGLKEETLKIPEASAKLKPFLSSPMISATAPGKLEVPWVLASDKIVSAYYEYDDVWGKHHKENINNISGGIIELDANVPHHNFRLVCSYKETGDKGEYLIEGVSTATQDMPLIHAPVGLTARPLGDRKAKVEVTWSVPYLEDDDLTPTDFFEVQRSLTGKEEDFVTINQVFFAKTEKKGTYSFIDSTLVDDVTTAMLKDGGTLDNLTYRVRRTVAQDWGWDHNCATSTKCVVDRLHLLRIADYSAKWEDEKAYTVRVSWNYEDEHNAVWDERAKMVLRVISKNRDGVMVDSLIYNLEDADRAKRYKIVNLTRSCVYYDVDMYVERGESPINFLEQTEDYFFPIRNAGDWHKFAVMINEALNTKDINARLYADIETGEHVGVDPGAYYRGVFDGNGHTVTFTKTGWTDQYMAPFRYVGNATIKNLHVAGTVNTTGQYAGGLIAYILNDNNVTIENCRSSMTIKSTNFTNGGFISRLGDNATVVISNSKFDGAFEGAESHHNGGFVGYCQSKSKATIVNSLFAPDHISTKLDKCQTWARGGDDITLSVVNSYATISYDEVKTTIIDGKSFMVLYNNDDWMAFKEAVKTNDYTNAILANDFTVYHCIAWDGEGTFRGIFDGNGHTLNMDINAGDASPVGLFKNASDYTIKNLHLTGRIIGGLHTGGLVGNSTAASSANRNHINNCRVSATVESVGWLAGGFIGRGNYADVLNCLFDGYIGCNQAKTGGLQWWVGAFYGFLDGDLACCVQTCLEKGSYKSGTEHIALNIKPWGYWGNGANEWNRDNWSYSNLAYTKDANAVAMETMLSNLGSNWELIGGNAYPKMPQRLIEPDNGMSMDEIKKYLTTGWVEDGTTINPQTTQEPYNEYRNIPKPTLPDFYHKNTGEIEKTLLTTTRQSSVLLAWNTDGRPIDYFRVLRRVQGEGDDKWVEIATDLDQMSYEDTSVSPLATYEYKVQAVNDCEGITTTETEVKVGECKHTGRLEGYVRFNDGTSAPDVHVSIYHVKGTTETLVKDVITDESGYFEADELSYYGESSAQYKVVPVSGDNIKFEVDDYLVTFNATSNDETVHEFIITNGKRFSGFVMFDGTSIPVKGANFLVNGRKMHNAKGDVLETDYDGSFSFRVKEGDNTIQAVMDGHKFTNEGWYKNSNAQSIKSDVAGIYFYDATKVKLIGRIVGGDDQGNMPLDNNLSKNNLGDSLTLVLTLEGDNTSWLVYDNLNPNKTKREEVVHHQRNGDKHYTSVTTERKRMTVWPDPTTGEYELTLPPVRWKVQQVYCKGYPTLFQEGQVSEVVDLTNCLTLKDTTYVGSYKDIDSLTVVTDPKVSYNAIYNRIYHSPVEVTYKQKVYDSFSYFGDKEYACSELTGKTTQIPLAYPNPKDTTQAKYSFEHPVFSVERKYIIQLQVAERYPYNNDPYAKKVDLVRLSGGTAYMQNGMNDGALFKEPQLLDSLGQATFTVKANQTTTLLTGLSALKTVTFTVERDGTYYEAEPLRGYVLNMFPVGASQDILTDGQPMLFDILRDPPGGYSSNTLAKGTTLNYTYMMNLSLTAGLYMNFKTGEKLETVSATVVAPSGAGTAVGPISGSDMVDTTIDALMYNAQGSKAFSYTMVVGNNVSTSGDPSMVGADADLYIGSVQNVVVTPMSTIRAVTKKMYYEMIARQGLGVMPSEVAKWDTYGTVVKIAGGVDEKGDSVFLIRDVALGYGPKIQSNFIYSQKQLLTQIIPAKAKEIVDMMYLGTKDEAQTIADKTGQPVYLSLRLPTDSLFAVVNRPILGRKDLTTLNDSIDVAGDGINYLMVLPSGKPRTDFSDEVSQKYYVIKAWADMIARNEHEKLSANDLLTNYDVAGAAGVNYSETFDTNYSNSFTHHFPVATEVDYFGLGAGVSNAASAVSIGASIASAIAISLKEMKKWTTPSAELALIDDENGMKSEVTFAGKLFKWTVFPIISYTTIGTNSQTKAYNRTESFTIALDPYSHLSVDVYRAKLIQSSSGQTVTASNIFTNDNFFTYYNDVYEQVKKDLKADGIDGPRSFIFRTRGGSTQNPWEDQRVTTLYRPGAELDARTLKIVNPKIRLDKQSVSGVSVNDPAVFTIYVSNESEKSEATEGLTVLQLFAVDQMNPLGARISVNGQVLTTGGMSVTTVPGSETALTMEVRAGQGFDFENLTIGVMSPTDPEHTFALATFNVHFLREAGGVNIATPGDKWVLNTNAQMDSKRGWYIPVTINGFDRHQYNFDHIEFQYKESQRGDDSWTNLCSFYASDSLMANANGVRELIPENGNIVTQFYGEGWVMEREYDLRAVLFCRNGSDFLTTPSKIITGIKDTRRPQLFGTPEPKSGLLTQNDDIIFNFSEDIEHNYLSAITNFEVKGEVNNNNLSEMVSVQFTGNSSVESEAKRNFSGKDLTIDMMVKPAETGREMPLFSHGTNGQKLQLWLTADFHLKAVVNDQVFTSDSVIGKNAFRQVAMTISQADSTLTFYKGGVQIGSHKLTSLYTGTGTLIFGRTNENDRSTSQFYEGRMMEARLWYSAMDGGLIGTTYGGRRLTGYEKNLVDYYPMSEGSGDYAIDHTQGANAMLIGANWAIPRGLSLHVEKADKGVLLDKNAMNRTAEHDYTLMFWFKTDADGRGALLSNGRGLKEDVGGENLFHIGFEGDKLMYRSNGYAVEVPGNWSDGNWHNYAMTVNRAYNVANIYMDKELVTTFESDSLGGISGGYPLIGATRYDVVKENGDVEVKDGDDALKGNVDELLFFAQALPQQLIKTYTTKSPNGDEAGLLTYLSFDRQERQKDNSIELVAYAYSKKLYLDDNGQPRYQLDPLTKEPTDILVRDYLFADSIDVVMKYFDATQAAPVLPYEEVTNLKFAFVGKDNQLLVELNEPAAKMHRRNIYVTVRDVEDKNGNTMASPQTASFLVNNSSIEWLLNKVDCVVKYGAGETLDLAFYNYSSAAHTYTIENCPSWLTLGKYTDVLAPQTLDGITAMVSKDLNIGTYNEIIYLTDEEGITEPLYLNLTVEGDVPDWAQSIDSNLLKNSMSIIGQVYLYDQLDTDARDIVGVFDNENVCHGFANITHSAQTGETGLYLTVYDNEAKGRQLNFRLWQYSTGRELMLITDSTLTFEKSAVLGADKPVRFDGGDTFVQNFKLQEGWNWVSFNVSSKQLDKVYSLLNTLPLQNGDVITDLSSDLTMTYADGKWLSTDNPDSIVVSSKNSYAIKVQKACVIPIGGTVIKDQEERTIDLKQGWNGIGYTPVANLSVETALSDYFDHAQSGDVVKSQTEFAYFSKSGNTGRWQGSLKYMKPGEGYMMLRNGEGKASFTYPFYEPSNSFLNGLAAAPHRAGGDEGGVKNYRYTMCVSAVVEGFNIEEGDRLVAYAEGEVCGIAEVNEEAVEGTEPLYLTIGGDKQTGISFGIERNGITAVVTGELMTFNANAIVGSPDEPFVIDFTGATGIDVVSGGYEHGKWYTVNGVQLQEKPTRPGLYIYNGKKVVIKKEK